MTIIRKEYIAPQVETIEIETKNAVLLEMSFRDEETDTEWSQKRRPNTIWGASDGISSMGNSSK